ncbi:Major facilitator superfamily domain general substrate transporter [Penicillium cf. griseofulvum]|uniref:Major facilitator superfamily domain general substrate transporter n=1 Tax=Penicillium cf. griseofulvum TaxID=2972120 RepID=A0A9W9MG85_9EURO|nr:Major facilitator superfamily domain general substrate transporter [Penicillium cf. griseofulvum]KAJ5423239.1 Major facilitator superfamily domain general substrate transporter [Penicillium cf. griseofulvum]KAJ5431488.1 Major facilitator superfamily domain general substrate transporter [Penicillium cf. griseofulvum]
MGLWRPFSDEKEPKRPKFVELRSSKWFIMFIVSFATGTDIFMYGLIVPVTPTALKERAGIPEKDVQSWTSILLALYSAALLAFAPVVGYLADRAESRRWPLLVGLVALAAATSLLCVGTHIALWIVGRLFQGAAAAVVWTAGLALMVDTLGKDDLGQAIGYVTMAISIGTLAGPLLGGVLYENGGYYAVFGLAFAFVALDIVLRLVLIERRHAIEWLTPEMAPHSVHGDQSTEKKSGETLGRPMSPNGSEPLESQTSSSRSPGAFERVAILLSSPRLVVSVWAYFILALVLTSFDSVLPLFVHETFGWQQTGQGLVFLPLMVPHLIDPLTGFVIDKYPKSCRYIAMAAFLAAVPVMVLLRFVTHDSMQQKILLFALLACVGLVVAVAMPILVVEVFFAVKEKEDKTPDIFGRGGAMALAFGLSNMGFAAGSLIGPFFAGFIRQEAGWGAMGWALGLVTGISSVPILLFVGGSILKKPGSDNEGLTDSAIGP